jgi:methionyl-tRNA formyltransferase
MELGALTVYSTVNLIDGTAGKPQVQKQNEKHATPAPKIFKEDCRINWNKNADEVYNFIRGLSPYPAAFTVLNGKTIRIYKTRMEDEHFKGKPGSFKVNGEHILVNSKDGTLEILELQMESKKKMTAKEFLNGNRGLFGN